MELDLEKISLAERQELERNVFFWNTGATEGVGAQQLDLAIDIWLGMLCN
ncbi:hypothetical protein XYCOK13_36830 [Xylanibacillus composti]|uniref:Uncharacterized protein n=1 Tax=Xylanibacillus composti TaxID=1572762 RepID=A0A8J4H4T8_9BACL|nr:hypothetical protein XYCOK13_36830 [Xylanibacillus composti]